MSEDTIKARLAAATDGLRDRAAGGLAHFWRALFLRGCLAVLLGLAALVWPGASLGALAALVGLYLLIDGLVATAAQLRERDGIDFAGPAITIAIGVVLLLWPSPSLRLLMGLLGLAALVMAGSAWLSARRRAQAAGEVHETRTVVIALAVIGLVLLLWPGAGVTAAAWTIALAALLLGGLLIWLALRLKALATRVSGEREP